MLPLSLLAGLILIFYLYQKGMWREILLYYKYFFEVKRLQSFIASFGEYAAGMYVLLQCGQVFLAPVPGEITGFVGGLLFGKWLGTILSTAGLLAGSLLAFSLSRVFGMKLVEKIVKKKYVDRFDHFITHRGLHLTFLLFLIPGFPKDSLCYLLGISHMRYRDFIIINIFGRLPGTLVLAWEGDAVSGGKYQEFFVLLMGSVILVFVLFFTRHHIAKHVSSLMHAILRKRSQPHG